MQHPADDPNSDQITTHFEYHSMEENLLKLDILGHQDPTMIRMLQDLTGLDPVKDIPLGWKQKLAFSIAMIHDPEILFLDEPTGGVDPKTRRNFWDMINESAKNGVTVFVTTHYMDEAEYPLPGQAARA